LMQNKRALATDQLGRSALGITPNLLGGRSGGRAFGLALLLLALLLHGGIAAAGGILSKHSGTGEKRQAE
jgi:hypothetical protein